MLGVSTTGNATLIAYDDKPILATDPWFGDENPAYFGSWGLSHRIPPDCKNDILNAEYIWFSHGHPDHLNGDSLQQIHGRHILLGDHVGGRIAHDLREQGFAVSILPDRQWVELSPRVKVFCISTMIQDSILLVDVNKRLFVNLNDAGSRDCTMLIRKIVAGYQHSYMMCLSGYGDADMINFYDENGVFIAPPAGPLARHPQRHSVQLVPLLSARRFDLGAELRYAARGLCARLRPQEPQFRSGVLAYRLRDRRGHPAQSAEHGNRGTAAGRFRRQLERQPRARRSRQAGRLFPQPGAGARLSVVHQFPRRRPRQFRLARRQEGPRHHLRGAAQQPDDGDRLRDLRRSPDRQFHEDHAASVRLAL